MSDDAVDGDCCVSDVDECLDSHGACHHLCVNTEGSYECACNVGYTLLPDRRNCIRGIITPLHYSSIVIVQILHFIN